MDTSGPQRLQDIDSMWLEEPLAHYSLVILLMLQINLLRLHLAVGQAGETICKDMGTLTQLLIFQIGLV